MAFVGYKLINRLKEYFPEFYEENKKKLILSVIGMTVPLGLKSIHNLSISLFKAYDDLMFSRYGPEHLIYNIVLVMTPAYFQLSTLIFGFIRRTK